MYMFQRILVHDAVLYRLFVEPSDDSGAEDGLCYTYTTGLRVHVLPDVFANGNLFPGGKMPTARPPP